MTPHHQMSSSWIEGFLVPHPNGAVVHSRAQPGCLVASICYVILCRFERLRNGTKFVQLSRQQQQETAVQVYMS